MEMLQKTLENPLMVQMNPRYRIQGLQLQQEDDDTAQRMAVAGFGLVGSGN